MNCWTWYIKDFINKKGSWDFPLKCVPFTCCSKQMKFGEKQIDESHFVIELLSCVRLFVTPWTAACQASLSLTISWSLLKVMFTELMMPSNDLSLCHHHLFSSCPQSFPTSGSFPMNCLFASCSQAGGRGDDREWDGWMTSPTRWTWVWVNSGSWWWTGRPGVLRFMGSQRVGHDWPTELN